VPPFPKPALTYNYRLDSQLAALRRYRDEKPGREIPDKADDRLLLATWNVANLGLQERRASDYRLIVEIISWFDLIVLQEVNDDLSGLFGIREHLPDHYRVLHSDAAGNDERVAYLYDSRKVTLGEEVGELAIPPSHLRYIRIPGSEQRFEGFDRNPYLALFHAGSLSVQLAGVHLYFGSDSAISMNRRSLETMAVARWAASRRTDPHAATRDIVALGDFNLPKAEPGDPIYDQLTSRGLHLPGHSTQIGSSIASDSHYDQVAFFPEETEEQFTGRIGVFDFDGALFHELWEDRSREEFLAYVRYYISDHRPLWAEFQI
jgi:endonuclease/exonuclease/phosphatase family metal-dependent hydrolase